MSSKNKDNSDPPRRRNARKRWLVDCGAALFVLIGAAYGAYWALVLRHYESTDNAYVRATSCRSRRRSPARSSRSPPTTPSS